MSKEQVGYVKETITFLRPSLLGRRYLNHKDCEFVGKPDGDMYVVEEKVEEVKEIKKT